MSTLKDIYGSFGVMYARDKAGLPTLQFKEESALTALHEFLSENIVLNIDSDATEEEVTLMVLEQIQDIMCDPNNAEYTSILSRAASELSVKVSEANNYIRGALHNEVSATAEDIQNRIDESLKRMGAEALVDSAATPSADFGFLNWGKLNNMGYVTSLFELCKTDLRMMNPSDLSKNNVQIARGRYNTGPVDSIDFGEGYRDELLDKLDRVVSGRNRDELEAIFLLISDKNAHQLFLKELFSLTDPDARLLANNCAQVLDSITNIRQTITGLRRTPMNMSDESKTKLLSNMGNLEKTTNIAEYFVLYCREFFKGNLLLSDNLLNYQEYKKYQQDGGRLDEIAMYLRVIHGDNEVPRMGVPTTRMISDKEQVQNNLAAYNVRLKGKAAALKSQALVGAYTVALENYLTGLPDSAIPENVDRFDFMREITPNISRTLNMATTRDGNIEDGLYQFFIDSFHKGSLVEAMYRRMTKEYTKVINQQDDVDDATQMQLTDSYVIASMISDYLVTRHCE